MHTDEFNDHVERSGVLAAVVGSPVVDEEVAGIQGKTFGTRPGQSDRPQKVWCPLEILDFIC